MTVSTFYPDTDPETTSVDGAVLRSVAGEVWATIRDTAAATHAQPSETTDNIPRIEAGTTSGQWTTLQRGFLLFDSSGLPDGDTVDSATFEFVSTAKADTLSPAGQMRLVTANPASNTNLVTGDYDDIGTVAQATDKTVASVTADSATYNAMTLNATGLGNISKTGVTKFGIRSIADADNAEPTWAFVADQFVKMATAEEVLAGDKRPKLVVTHTGAGDPEGSLLGGKLLRGGLLQHGVLVRH